MKTLKISVFKIEFTLEKVHMINAIYLTIYGVMIAGAVIHLTFTRTKRITKRVLEILLLWVFGVTGIEELWHFYRHIFMADRTAHYIGFPAGNPFQFEVGMAHLAIAVLTLLCLKIRGSFWIATVIAICVIDFGAAIGHIQQILFHYNFSPGNAGLTLYLEILTPIISVTLLTGYMSAKKFPKGV